MAALLVALQSARSLLNDDNAVTWSDAILIPKAQEAFRELQLELELNNVPVIKKQTAIITVTAGSTDLGVNQPADLVNPIELQERDPGGDLEDFSPMQEVRFIPLIDQVEELIYWAWNQQKVQLLGATQNREVLLRYQGTIPMPNNVTDDLGFIFAELYVGPRTAGLAAKSDVFNTQANNNLEKIIRYNTTADQLPTRHLPYRRGRIRRVF